MKITLFRNPRWNKRTLAALSAVAIAGAGAGLRTSSALSEGSGQIAHIRVAAADASSTLTLSADPGTEVYAAPDLSGIPLGTTSSAGVTATCRTPIGGVQILYPAGTGGIGYIAAPSTLPGTLIDCPALPGSTTGANGQSTAAQCVAQQTDDVLFSEFIKNWILNNAETWASDLTAQGDTHNPPTADSQIVSDALSMASSSLYDESSAFADAVKSALRQEILTTYPDCNDPADGQEAQWKKDLFNHLADRVTNGLLKATLQQIESAVAAEANSQSGSQQQDQGKDQNGCDTTALAQALPTLGTVQTTGFGIDAGGSTYQFQSGRSQAFLVNGQPWSQDDHQLSDNANTRLRYALNRGDLTGYAIHAEPKMAQFMYEQRTVSSLNHVCVVINNPQGPCPYAGTLQPYGCQTVVPLLLAKDQEMDVYWQPVAGLPLTSMTFTGTAN
jgi:hypothetical protein